MTALALIISLIYMLFFYGMWMIAWRFGAGSKELISILTDKRIYIIFCVFAFSGLFLCVWLLSKERFVYFWDYGAYWTSSCETMR